MMMTLQQRIYGEVKERIEKMPHRSFGADLDETSAWKC